jgi:hypothetical protein
MNARFDIEALLKRLRTEPSPRVKRAVLSKYAECFGGARQDDRGTAFWRRPVPLYAAALIAVVAVALSVAGERMLARESRRARESSANVQDSLAAPELEQKWQFAPRDVL